MPRSSQILEAFDPLHRSDRPARLAFTDMVHPRTFRTSRLVIFESHPIFE